MTLDDKILEVGERANGIEPVVLEMLRILEDRIKALEPVPISTSSSN